MKQLLINIDDAGALSVELHATVPSGMGVMLDEMRTHQLAYPMQIELKPSTPVSTSLRPFEIFRIFGTITWRR